MNRIHIVKKQLGDRVVTFCGMAGWASAFKDEYDTALGDRFEARNTNKGANCRKCLLLQERLDETVTPR